MVKTSTLAMILGMMVLSVVVFANEADGAGLVWRAVNKAGSLISDLGNVAGGCTNGQTLHYQSNSTFVCELFKVDTKSASNDVFITGINNQTGVITTNQFSVNLTTCSGTNKVSAIDNATGHVTCSTDSGLASINADSTAAQLISGVAGNTTANTSTGTTTINLGSNVLMTTGSPQSSSKAFTLSGQNAIDFANAGLVVRNPASTFATTLQGGKIIANTTLTLPNATKTLIGGSVLSSNQTTSLTTSHLLVWTIPLTANAGNLLDFNLVAFSNTNGVAPQIGLNTTVSGSRGWCTWVHPTTATATEVDFVSANSTNRFVRDTGATAWITTTTEDPAPITGKCAIKTGATPGDAKLWLQAETTGTVGLKKGSMVFVTP